MSRRYLAGVVVLIAVLGVGCAAVFKTVREPEAVVTASGLKYIDLVVGQGATPQDRQTVSVHYTGALENGQQVENSYTRETPAQFRLGVGALIPGWEEGIKTMKVGGKRRLIIPPELAYGSRGIPPKIPPNATLVFEIELLDVN